MKRTKVAIVEDNDSFREGLQMLLGSIGEFEILANVPGFNSLINTGVLPNVDIVLMDLMMPEIDGMEAAKSILWDFPYIPILAITMFTDKAYLLELMEAGFKGCVFKSNIYNELGTAISTILDGKLYFPKEIQLSRRDIRKS